MYSYCLITSLIVFIVYSSNTNCGQIVPDYELKFKSQVKDNKLLIKVYENDIHKYSGQLDQNPLIKFSKIMDLLHQGKLQVKQKNSDVFSIQLMDLFNIDFISVQKKQKDEFNQIIKQLANKHLQYEIKVNKQDQKIKRYETQIFQLTNAVKELKENIVEISQSIIKILQIDVKKKNNKINQEINYLKHSITNQFLLNEFEIKINQLNQTKNSIMSSIEIQQKKNEQLQKRIESLQQTFKQIKDESDYKLIQLIDDCKQYKKQINNLNQFIAKNLTNVLESKTIEQYKGVFAWSQRLKSRSFLIDNNLILKRYSQIPQFALLNIGFSKTNSIRQSWFFKINKNTDWIGLGVCLRSNMVIYNYTNKGLKWGGTGHGLYLISSSGYCYSHSHKEFNSVKKNFDFDEGDVIRVEYDSMDSKIRFISNYGKYFQMPIIAPPQNDYYHPCVSIQQSRFWSSQYQKFYQYVELIQP